MRPGVVLPDDEETYSIRPSTILLSVNLGL